MSVSQANPTRTFSRRKELGDPSRGVGRGHGLGDTFLIKTVVLVMRVNISPAG